MKELFLNRFSGCTKRSYSNAIRIFEEKFGENIFSVSVKDLLLFQSELKESGMKSSSVNSYFRNVKAYANWLVQSEMIDSHNFNKIKPLKESKKTPDYFTDEEIDSLLAVANSEERIMFVTLLYTGIRRDELTNVKLSDINQGVLKIHGKGDKERNIPLADELIIEIEKYIKNRKGFSEYLIVSHRHDGNGEYEKITGNSVYNRLKSMAKRAKIDEKRMKVIRPHNVRKSFAVALLTSGEDVTTVKELLGHANITTTMIYTTVVDSVKRKAVNGLKFGKE